MRVPGSERNARARGAATARAALALVAILVAACGNSSSTPAGPTAAQIGPDGEFGLLPGEAPSPVSGPDLGEAWTTAPDPEFFVALPDGTMVSQDQYLIMLDSSSTKADAEAVAASVDGEIGGHIEYLGIWKVIVWPNYHTAIITDRLNTLAEQPGVLAASYVTLVAVDEGPTCAPALADQVYSGGNSGPYEMVQVEAAWQAFYASGLKVNPVHVGFLDTVLTQDPNRKIPWEFEDVTFVGDPHTTPDPRPVTQEDQRTDGFHHADGTLGILAGSPSNGGIAGIASPLGSRLMVSHDVLGGATSKGEPTHWTASDGMTYTDDALLKTLRQVESGATVISGSWGGYDAGDAQMWKAFFNKMAAEHPDVIFVYSAGNENLALSATTHYPGGIPSPNVITVGSVDTDGDRTSYSNAVVAGSTGEVTLGAPGHQAVWGTGADGVVRKINGGTSSAAPMVSATVALIRSVDPTLKAADIKKIIADTAVQGDPELGGKTLRVDLALRKAIDGARKRSGLDPLTDADIAAATAYCQIGVWAEITERLEQPAGSARWKVGASIEASVRPGRMVELSLVEDGLRPTNGTQAVTAGGSPASWTLLVSAKGAYIIVTRHDNGYWLKYALRDGLATPSPEETPPPEPTSAPTPAGSSYDCSNPPDSNSIEYIKWKLHCKPIGG